MTTALFLLDTALNSLMIILAMRITGRRIALGKTIAGALMGACIAGWTRATELTRMQTALLWLPAAMTMMAIAGGRPGAGKRIGAGMALLCAAGLLGGTIQALYGATGSLAAAYGLGCICTAAAAVWALRAQREAPAAVQAQVTICCRGTSASFEAIIDSGNTLRDYLTHLPVIVLPQALGRERLGLDNQPLRPIFADTAGGRQMMQCFTAERVWLELDGRRMDVTAAVALSAGLNERTPALIPAALVDGNQNG